MRFLTRCRHCSAITLLLAASLLSGCASQETSSSRFTLPNMTGESSSAENASSAGETAPGVLLVSTVSVANYLDQEGIVMQLSDIELNAANSNLWAENLGAQLSRNLRQSLTNHLPQATVLDDRQSSADARRLSVSVDQFQGRFDGQAVAAGEWQLREGNRLLERRHFEVTRPLETDGYPALVRTLGATWEVVGQQIAAAIARFDPAQSTLRSTSP